MKAEYKVTVERRIGGVNNELVARNVTADMAIDLLVHIQANISGQEDGDPEPEPTAEVVEDTPQPQKADRSPKKAKGKGKRGSSKYDREAVIADIEAGDLSNKEIANKHRISAPTISNIKKAMAEDDTRQEPTQSAATAYATRKREREEIPSNDIEDQVRDMIKHGLSMSELEMMFPKVPVATITSLYREMRPND